MKDKILGTLISFIKVIFIIFIAFSINHDLSLVQIIILLVSMLLALDYAYLGTKSVLGMFFNKGVFKNFTVLPSVSLVASAFWSFLALFIFKEYYMEIRTNLALQFVLLILPYSVFLNLFQVALNSLDPQNIIKMDKTNIEKRHKPKNNIYMQNSQIIDETTKQICYSIRELRLPYYKTSYFSLGGYSLENMEMWKTDKTVAEADLYKGAKKIAHIFNYDDGLKALLNGNEEEFEFVLADMKELFSKFNPPKDKSCKSQYFLEDIQSAIVGFGELLIEFQAIVALAEENQTEGDAYYYVGATGESWFTPERENSELLIDASPLTAATYEDAVSEAKEILLGEGQTSDEITFFRVVKGDQDWNLSFDEYVSLLVH